MRRKQKDNNDECQRRKAEVKPNGGTDLSRIEIRAQSIAGSIRNGNAASRELFKQRLKDRIEEQRRLKIATCMQNQRIQIDNHNERTLQGTNDTGKRVASLGLKGGGPSMGVSGSNDSNARKAKGGRHKGKGKGIGMAHQQHKGGAGEEAIRRLLAIMPK